MIRFFVFVLVLLFIAGSLRANYFGEISRTNENTLNDLVKDLPILSPSWSRQLGELSSIQEQLYLFEREMRGEGLDQPLAQAFSIHYNAIVSAMVEDRIDGEYGRELLSIHRQLLSRTHDWTQKRVRDENFPTEVMNNLHFFLTELKENALTLFEVADGLRTPVVNGYQVWLGELLAWGGEAGQLTPGTQGRLKHKLEQLERFEFYYKRDGVLSAVERRQLHERFLVLTRDTIDLLVR
ncbi:MAG: hypothetical protein P1U68_10045 [Verrucomicrobiales bacterium]|nr:hypothetical protein [Verrucomicrobiales bacterium]